MTVRQHHSFIELPDGNYTATLKSGSVSDLAGRPLADAASESFFVLAGDLNRDRTVDFFDLLTLRANYTQSGKVFSDGDINYDGVVDFFDLLLLRQNYTVTLAPPTGGSLFRGGSLLADDGGGLRGLLL